MIYSSPSAMWRLQKERYGTSGGGLLGSRCPEGHVHFPPREVCPECALLCYIQDSTAVITPEAVDAVEWPVEQLRTYVALMLESSANTV